jgi:trk system potassium uptake protein
VSPGRPADERDGKTNSTLMPRILKAATPIQILVTGFALIVLVSAVLLAMPFSSTRHTFQPFVDCVFMTSSAISTTGLVVADIGKDYTLFGQLVMLVVIQIGGIGYMCFLPLVVVGLLRGQMSISTRMILRESMARPTWLDMAKFSRVILISTAVIETIGAAILAWHWSGTMPLGAALYAGVFHSINAFCTAGMSIWTDNMMGIGTLLVPNLTIIVLELAGGIGFFVLYDVARKWKKVVRGIHPRPLTTHSRLALVVTAIVVGIGTLVVLATEWRAPGLNVASRVTAAAFQAVSASTTTGFNSVNIAAMSTPAIFMLTVLMFIGASPNSTGGGIKTTTLGVMVAGLSAVLKGREDMTVFRRRIPYKILHSAFSLTLAAGLWVTVIIGIMLLIEPATFEQIIFEVISAFGNVGLSMGITTSLSTASRLLLSATMFFGRLGPLAIGFSLIGRRGSPLHQYAEDEVYVG